MSLILNRFWAWNASPIKWICSQEFQDFLKSINFGASLCFSDSLKVQISQTICDGKINQLSLFRLKVAVIIYELELLFRLQKHLVGDQILETLDRRVLRLVKVNDVWNKLLSIWVIWGRKIRVNSLCSVRLLTAFSCRLFLGSLSRSKGSFFSGFLLLCLSSQSLFLIFLLLFLFIVLIFAL